MALLQVNHIVQLCLIHNLYFDNLPSKTHAPDVRFRFQYKWKSKLKCEQYENVKLLLLFSQHVFSINRLVSIRIFSLPRSLFRQINSKMKPYKDIMR